MREFINLLWALLGAILGLAVGLLADMFAFNTFTEPLQTNPTLAGIVLFGLPAMGMVAGGSVSLYITARIDRTRREKARVERKKFGAAGRKKK